MIIFLYRSAFCQILVLWNTEQLEELNKNQSQLWWAFQLMGSFITPYVLSYSPAIYLMSQACGNLYYRMFGISNIGWLDRPRCLLEFSKHAKLRSKMSESTKVWKVYSPAEWSIVYTACRVRHCILRFAKFHYTSKLKKYWSIRVGKMPT